MAATRWHTEATLNDLGLCECVVGSLELRLSEKTVSLLCVVFSPLDELLFICQGLYLARNEKRKRGEKTD